MFALQLQMELTHLSIAVIMADYNAISLSPMESALFALSVTWRWIYGYRQTRW